MAAYKADKTDPPMPTVSTRHLIDLLMEIGPVDTGPAPISWTTLRHWRAMTFARISAWEARTLRRLSAEYLAEIQAAEDRNRPAPWSPGRGEVDRKTEEQQLRALLG